MTTDHLQMELTYPTVTLTICVHDTMTRQYQIEHTLILQFLFDELVIVEKFRIEYALEY